MSTVLPSTKLGLPRQPIVDFAAAGDLSPEQFDRQRSRIAFRTPLQERTLTLVSIDMLCCAFAAAVGFFLWSIAAGETHPHALSVLAAKWYWLPVSLGLWAVVAWTVDLYDPALCGANAVVGQRAVLAMLLVTACFFSAYFFFPSYIPRIYFLSFVVAAGMCIVPARALLHHWSDTASGGHNLMLVGDGPAAKELDHLLGSVQRMKLNLVGWTGSEYLAALHRDHGIQGLARFAVVKNVHEIVVSRHGGTENDNVYRALVECQANGIRVSSMAEVYRKLSRQIPIDFVDSQWVLSAMQDRVLFTRMQLGIKRAFDIVGALVAMPFILLILPIVALAIKLDSPGSVFYCQERTGRGGRKFLIVKFRTMTRNAEVDGQAVWAAANDQRITRVGKWLRKTRIDELPQFINVLWGEMSLVGPRPEREQFELELDQKLPHYFIRRLVKPGITGWAQVHYGYGNSVEDSRRKLQYDAYYVRHWSIVMDLYVLLRTVGVVFLGKGL